MPVALAASSSSLKGGRAVGRAREKAKEPAEGVAAAAGKEERPAEAALRGAARSRMLRAAGARRQLGGRRSFVAECGAPVAEPGSGAP